jgi:hypothetical protein
MTKEDPLKVSTCLVMVMEVMAHRKYLFRMIFVLTPIISICLEFSVGLLF